ncbi:MAG: radical SAM protein, partial [Gemmatimonadales bacterium]
MADEQFDALGESGPDGWQEIERLRRGTSFIAITPRRVLNPPSATGMKFWSLNPYIGCEFGCSYCYARDTHRWTVERAADRRDAAPAAHDAAAMPPDESFERRILVKRGAAEKLLRTLHPDRLRGASLMIGTATDPYQPAERRFGVTRSLLEALLGFRELRLGIITKSPLIVRDAGLLVRLTEQHDVSISISIASVDAPLLRRLEPRTPTPAARLRALRRLAGAGLRCSALIAPILPGITDGRSALRAVVRAAHD